MLGTYSGHRRYGWIRRSYTHQQCKAYHHRGPLYHLETWSATARDCRRKRHATERSSPTHMAAQGAEVINRIRPSCLTMDCRRKGQHRPQDLSTGPKDRRYEHFLSSFKWRARRWHNKGKVRNRRWVLGREGNAGHSRNKRGNCLAHSLPPLHESQYRI